MQTFKDWVSENHPEDELLNEFLGDVAKRIANSKMGRAAMLAGALTAGTGGVASGAMPMPPKMTQQQDDYSAKPFDKSFSVSIAKEMGASPNKIEEMSDFDAWHLTMTKVRKLEDEMNRMNMAAQRGGIVKKKEVPRWYVKFGTYYGWKAPKAPEVK